MNNVYILLSVDQLEMNINMNNDMLDGVLMTIEKEKQAEIFHICCYVAECE